jgi:hypothetical protein
MSLTSRNHLECQASSACRLLAHSKDLARWLNASIVALIIAVCFVFLNVNPLHAERKYTLGHSLDIMGGASNESGNLNADLTTSQPGLHALYSAYPSIDLISEGQHSTYDLHYSFVFERFHMDPILTTTSHAFTGNYAGQIGSKTHLRLSDTLNTVPDYSLLNVLRGTAPSDGFKYVFEPQLFQRTNISNTTNIGLDVDLNEKSYLAFKGSGAFLFYDENAESAALSDQIRSEGSFSFMHRHSSRLSWGLKYTFLQNDYELYATSRSHSGTLVLSGTLSPTWELNLEAGPSFAEERELVDSYISYIADVNLARQMRTNRFSVGYAHNVADSTGLGSSSENHNGMMSFSQMLGSKLLLDFQAVGFKQDERESDLYDYWGVQGSAALTRKLGKYWVFSLGASYMTYIGRTGNYQNYSSERYYASIGYRIPELWKGEK